MAEGEIDRWTNRQMDRRIDGHMAEEEKDRWTDEQMDGRRDR